MRNAWCILFFLVALVSFGQPNTWMSSLEAAKRLSLVQDKMVLMIWEDAALEPLAVTFEDAEGERVFIQDLYKNEVLINMLRDYFILVKVNEYEYESLLEPLKGLGSTAYMSKFNDNSIKVMDANGYILNVNHTYYRMFLNLSDFILKYGINTRFLKAELSNYRTQQNMVTALRLGAKYIDLAIYTEKAAREEVISLSTIYLDEVKRFLENDISNKLAITEKVELLNIKQELILGHTKKALRQLKRIGITPSYDINKQLMAFLYWTSYAVLGEEEQAVMWKSKVSLVNLTKSEQIINNSK